MKCKCGHEKGSHDKDGVCWQLIDSQGVYVHCWCNNFTGKPKPRRRAKPFRRWSGYRGGWVKFDGVDITDASVLAKLLNCARVVLPKRRRS